MARYPKRARIEAITALTLLAVPPRSWAAGGQSFLAAFDQATLAAIFAVGPPLGLAAHQSAEPAEGNSVKILAWLLHHLAPLSNILLGRP